MSMRLKIALILFGVPVAIAALAGYGVAVFSVFVWLGMAVEIAGVLTFASVMLSFFIGAAVVFGAFDDD